MRILVISLLAVALIASCNKRKNQIAFDGQYYKTKVSKLNDDLAQFQINVSPVSASLDGARAAGRHEATKYCVENFGLSDTTWVAGPDAELANLNIDGDTLLLRGMCDG
ncbi:MAG: hypothetical protein ABJI96_15365 [Paracoccaceae bacterium]